MTRGPETDLVLMQLHAQKELHPVLGFLILSAHDSPVPGTVLILEPKQQSLEKEEKGE